MRVCGPFLKWTPRPPPVSQEVLGLCHGALSLFQLGMSVDPVNNRFTVALDLQGRPLPSQRYMKFKREQVPWLLCRPGPVVYVFLLHSFLHGFEQGRLRITSSFRGFRRAMNFIQSFSSPAHLAIGVSHCTPLLWNPTLCFHLCTLLGSHAMLQEAPLLYHAEVLHPKIERRASKMETSPS